MESSFKQSEIISVPAELPYFFYLCTMEFFRSKISLLRSSSEILKYVWLTSQEAK